MKRYLDEFTEEELLGFAKSAYGPAKFDTPAAAPVVKLTENTYIQELWHRADVRHSRIWRCRCCRIC